MDLPLTEDFGKEWTRAEHMNGCASVITWNGVIDCCLKQAAQEL